jgi:hypothetical protein
MLLKGAKYWCGHLLLLLILIKTQHGSAQSIPEDNTVAIIRANYLYQFANNNDWPAEQKRGPFVVGVVGNSDVFNIMAAKYASKPIGSQLLAVVMGNEVSTSQHVHVLFIDRSRKAEFARYAKEFKGKNTLIVTNWEGALAQGAHINFLSIDGSIRFEMNKAAMLESAITPGVKIIQWAIQ